jgi:hypothetical protein
MLLAAFSRARRHFFRARRLAGHARWRKRQRARENTAFFRALRLSGRSLIMSSLGAPARLCIRHNAPRPDSVYSASRRRVPRRPRSQFTKCCRHSLHGTRPCALAQGASYKVAPLFGSAAWSCSGQGREIISPSPLLRLAPPKWAKSHRSSLRMSGHRSFTPRPFLLAPVCCLPHLIRKFILAWAQRRPFLASENRGASSACVSPFSASPATN